jgi:hypothetical protein
MPVSHVIKKGGGGVNVDRISHAGFSYMIGIDSCKTEILRELLELWAQFCIDLQRP